MPELPSKWITVDIGETTGYSVLQEDRLICGGQAAMWDFVYAVGQGLTRERLCRDRELNARVASWELLVIEDWQLYPWTAEQMAWDKQLTVRGLGALQFIASALGRPCILQPAKIKEAAMAAGAEELFVRPLHDNRHQNDSAMHAVHYLATQGKGIVSAA